MNLFVKAHPYLSTAVLIWAGVITLLLVAIESDFTTKQEGDKYLASPNNPAYQPKEGKSKPSSAAATSAPSEAEYLYDR